jgi:hypothetical protein
MVSSSRTSVPGFYISGAPAERWDNDDLQELKNVKASEFDFMEIGTVRGQAQ